MNKLRYLLPPILAAALLPASAQAQEGRLLAPLDPAARTAPTAYVSAFSDYRPYQESNLVPWKESNAQVGQATGHGGHQMDHGKMDHGEDRPAEATKPPAPPPKPDPHAGHQHKE